MDLVEITPSLSIPAAELKFTFDRSSGPGGQNVNKLNTRALLRFDLHHSPSLNAQQRLRLQSVLGKQLNQDGVLAVRSDRFRTQGRNKEDCLDKFVRLMADGLKPPPPPRRPTRPSRGARQRQRQQRQQHSDKKAQRRRPQED
ncbi:MAG: aminoacyl-tRNA hydrolase [Candidatus Latescibacteria bacterium]|nr:aminoacyl-tRNA hydrolase [Candidatus Latescibacterota bacterium]